MTSAPNQASIWVADGPDWTCVMSSTRTPSRALPTKFLQKHRHRIRSPLSSYTARDRGPYLFDPLGSLDGKQAPVQGVRRSQRLRAPGGRGCVQETVYRMRLVSLAYLTPLCPGQSGCSAWENAVQIGTPCVRPNVRRTNLFTLFAARRGPVAKRPQVADLGPFPCLFPALSKTGLSDQTTTFCSRHAAIVSAS